MAKPKGTKKAKAVKSLTNAQAKPIQHKAAHGKHATPFTATPTGEIVDAGGTWVADCVTLERAQFICSACNQFRALTQLARLARGEVECPNEHESLIYRGASLQAMQNLFESLDYSVLHG